MANVQVSLTDSSYNKLQSGKNVRLAYAQLVENTNTNLAVSAALAKKVQAAIRAGRGVTLSSDEVDEAKTAQDINGSGIGRSFKRLGRAVNRGIDHATDAIEDTANSSAKYVNKNAGAWAEEVKSVVPRSAANMVTSEIIKQAITAAAVSTGQPELLLAIPAAQKAGQLGVNTIYADDFTKKQSTAQMMRSIKEGAKLTAQDAIQAHVSAQAQSFAGGNVHNFVKKGTHTAVDYVNGLKKKGKRAVAEAMDDDEEEIIDYERPVGGGLVRKLVKGSEQAKQHMAALRARRTVGGSARPLGDYNGRSAMPLGGSARPLGGSAMPLGGSARPLGGRMVKGSQAAKDYMASIRRKTTGGSIRLNMTGSWFLAL